MDAELVSEMPFGFRSAGKDHQAAGIFVEAVNGPYEDAKGRGDEGAREVGLRERRSAPRLDQKRGHNSV